MKKLPLILAAAGVLVALVAFSFRWQRVLEDGLPPRIECRSLDEAMAQAFAWKVAHGGEILRVLGTGSMAPYIPAAPIGVDPRSFTAAFVVTSGEGFAALAPGRLCAYRPAFAGEHVYLHQAATQDAGGWIMTGLANRHYEWWARVTPENFVGLAAATFVIAP